MENEVKIYGGSERAGILKDAGFRLFDLNTVSLYREYLAKMNGPTGSYLRIANILCWGFYSIPYYTIKDGFFIIFNDDAYYRSFISYTPVGDYSQTEALEKAIGFITEMSEKLGTEPEILQVKEWMKPYYDRLAGYRLEAEYDAGESDYIYSLSELEKSIESRKLHYENKAGRFVEKYSPEVSLFTPDDYGKCMDIIGQMYCDNGGCENCVFGCMKVFYDRAIEVLPHIGGHFYVFRSHGEVIAFTLFVDDEDLLYFDRKATHDLNGFSEYLNMFIVKEFGSRYESMNFEEDMGSEGLRRHKKALGPYTLSHNYKAKIYRICQEN